MALINCPYCKNGYLTYRMYVEHKCSYDYGWTGGLIDKDALKRLLERLQKKLQKE